LHVQAIDSAHIVILSAKSNSVCRDTIYMVGVGNNRSTALFQDSINELVRIPTSIRYIVWLILQNELFVVIFYLFYTEL